MTELVGGKELLRKVNQLGNKLGTKVMRSAALKATTPTLRRMKSRAPRGTESHKTHKGRWVGPGFLSRSLRRRTRVDKSRGVVSVTLGVRSEAYYGINFLDRGPHTITQRRVSLGNKRRQKRSIKPYTLRQRPWFTDTFTSDHQNISKRFRELLSLEIKKAVKNAK